MAKKLKWVCDVCDADFALKIKLIEHLKYERIVVDDVSNTINAQLGNLGINTDN